MLKYTLYLLLFTTSFNVFAQSLSTKNCLSYRMEMCDSLKHNTKLFSLSPYKPVYVLFGNYTNHINQSPYSETQPKPPAMPADLNNVELKFQFSTKIKVAQNILGEQLGGDIWLRYTQTSRWQVYNTLLSRPFRETNYEPEALFVMPTPYHIFGLHGVYVGIGINHQSNGRSNPHSRSWNRVFLEAGLETPNLNIVLRPWWRLQEPFEIDDNPGIENFIGRGEIMIACNYGRHSISAIARHSLKFKELQGGGFELDYAVKMYNYLKLHAQVYHGYGESMIDFNHFQTTIGLGLSLIVWR